MGPDSVNAARVISALLPKSPILEIGLPDAKALSEEAIRNYLHIPKVGLNVLLRSACVAEKPRVRAGVRRFDVAGRGTSASQPQPAAAMACS